MDSSAEQAARRRLGSLDRPRPDSFVPALDCPDPRLRAGPPDRRDEPVAGAAGRNPDDRTRRVRSFPGVPALTRPERAIEYLRSSRAWPYEETASPRMVGHLVLVRTGHQG
jgi:hypothetical protein